MQAPFDSAAGGDVATSMLTTWKERARALKLDVAALGVASRDPRVPWYTKALLVCVVAYALSPIDLVPDPIPVLGYLDDLMLVPLGVLAVRRMIPAPVWEECRARAREGLAAKTPGRWIAAVLIVAIWIAVAVVLTRWLSAELRP